MDGMSSGLMRNSLMTWSKGLKEVPYLKSILGKDEHVLVFSGLEPFTVKVTQSGCPFETTS